MKIRKGAACGLPPFSVMDEEKYKKHRPYAGEKKPSMLRRRVGHDYESRRMYLITMTVEGRRPLLGRLVGRADAEEGSGDAPRVELSELGERVKERWMDTPRIYPEVSVVALQIMPDHLHGVLFVKEQMGRHLGQVIKGFKTGCNKEYRKLGLAAATRSQQREPEQETLGCAATESQQAAAAMLERGEQQESGEAQAAAVQAAAGGKAKRDRRLDDREHGQLWALGYNDHILEGAGELQRWIDYLKDNPRRLAIRRAHGDYFRVRFGITIGSQSYAAIGNRFLLQHPRKEQVQLSRRLTDEQIQQQVERYLALARSGAVLVSPAISKGEQAVMRAVLDARLPLIFLTPWGFNSFSRPGHQFYDACAEGRFLILAPWPHENQRMPLTRSMCLKLNQMAKEIVCYFRQT